MEHVDAGAVGGLGSGCPAVSSVEELGPWIVDFAGRLAASTARWLVLLAEFDAREGYLTFGLASTAQWLSHACGIAHRTAAEHVRVGRSLRQYPRLAQEMGAGRLSFSQVRAISRIIAPDELALVEDLIEAARHATVAQLEVVVRGLRSVEHNDPATDAGEYLKQSWASDSRWQLSVRLDPERGALVAAAIDAVVARDGGSRADALLRLAEIGLAALADAANPPRSLRGHEHAAVIIQVEAAQVPSRSAERGSDDAVPGGVLIPGGAVLTARPYARIAGGPGLSDQVVARLLCDSRIRTVIVDGDRQVLDVGRSHRLVTDHQYRALQVRQHRPLRAPGLPEHRGLACPPPPPLDTRWPHRPG
jgi:hypothetical protein